MLIRQCNVWLPIGTTLYFTRCIKNHANMSTQRLITDRYDSLPYRMHQKTTLWLQALSKTCRYVNIMFDYWQMWLFTLQDALKNNLVTTGCVKKHADMSKQHLITDRYDSELEDASKNCLATTGCIKKHADSQYVDTTFYYRQVWLFALQDASKNNLVTTGCIKQPANMSTQHVTTDIYDVTLQDASKNVPMCYLHSTCTLPTARYISR